MDFLRKLWIFMKQPRVYRSAIAVAASIPLVYLYIKSQPQKVKLSVFLSELKDGKIKEVIDFGDTINFRSIKNTWLRTSIDQSNKKQILNMASEGLLEYSYSTSLQSILANIVRLTFGIGAVWYLMSSILKEQPKRIMNHRTSVTFGDIAGNVEAKKSLQEIIDYFKFPEKYLKMGAKLPRGVLLYGPPGTGKTMLAKATASESGVNFIQTSGSEYMEMFVGVGAKRVRDIFQQARSNSPCILFIDEIETLAIKRGAGSDKANLEYLSTLNQLLTEMDGFVSSDKIVVLGATNNQNMLDEAILRPGRFDRKIVVKPPNKQARLQILNLHLKNKKFDLSDTFLYQCSLTTKGLTGADIAGIVNEACYIALRQGKDSIEEDDITQAVSEFNLKNKEFLEKNFKKIIKQK
jgi:cell division protease FtsH